MSGGGAPRLLVIMGSGETSPTMSKVHRRLLAEVGSPPAPAVLLDTPYGFQENAADISSKAVEYFAQSVGQTIEVATFRSAAADDVVERETTLTTLRESAYVFAGPGSPSYALTQWSGSEVPLILADKLSMGGCVTFASAAACTVGAFALPVYEIYKVGQSPHWLDGLNLLEAATGLGAALVPHYNNAEGGNHDTRFCYMGERRLSAMERMLPDGVFVLGVDEHTAAIFDLDAGTVSIAGLGAVTVRRAGASETLATGESAPIAQLMEMARGGTCGGATAAPGGASAAGSGRSSSTERAAIDASAGDPAADLLPAANVDGPLLIGVANCESEFSQALATGDGRDATRCLLELDDLLVEWSRDTTQSDHLDRGRATLRSLLVRLGAAAEVGLRDPRQVVAPLVEALLESRLQARTDRRFAESDLIRDRLVAAGIEVHDTPNGTHWDLC